MDEPNPSDAATRARHAVPEGLSGVAPSRVVKGRNRTKADIFFYEASGKRVAVKSYSARTFWIRHTLGRWLTRRESRAFLVTKDIDGIPPFLDRLDAFTLATEWIPSRALSALRGQILEPRIFDRVAEILDDCHEHGLALGDVHHRDVLLCDDGRVFVVDLATAWVLGERPGSWRRAVFRRLRDADRVGLARMRARFLGENVDAAVEAVGTDASRWHRRGRRIKNRLDRLRGRRRAP